MKKIFSLLISLALTFTAMWAMPGFESYIPDSSGEYVYYKDNTFHRESYLGILYYDQGTIKVRYFAPADKEQGLPENEISILMTVDPESPFWDMTGERILSTITPNTDDVEIVNYLHDILYEFSSHRIRVDNVNERDIGIYQEFTQFGGNVEIVYDCTIPMFNIKEIKKSDGTKLLQCITVGQIISDTDTSFDNFKGFPEDKYKKGWKRYFPSKDIDYKFENQSITLDKKWEQAMDLENMWLLGDDSILTLNTMPPVNNDKNMTENYLIRFFAKSKQGTYMDYNTLKINTDTNKLSLYVESYNPENKKTVVNNIIICGQPDSANMDILSLATYKQPWLNNKKYYENILKSYNNQNNK